MKPDGTEAFSDTYAGQLANEALAKRRGCPDPADELDETAAMPDDRRRSARRPRLSAATTVVGVIGDPVAHSLSPRLHNAAFADLGLDWVSVGFPVAAGGRRRRPGRRPGPRDPGTVGDHAPQGGRRRRSSTASVTEARRLGAVNCVTVGAARDDR